MSTTILLTAPTLLISGLEAAFYSSLRANSPSSSAFTKRIKEITIPHIQEIQTVFNTLNAVIVLFYAKKHLFSLRPTTAILAATAYFTGFGILYYYSRMNPPRIRDDGLEVSKRMSIQQSIAQYLHVTKVVVSIALVCFSQHRLLSTLAIAASIYSLLKNSQLKWLHFSKTFTDDAIIAAENHDFDMAITQYQTMVIAMGRANEILNEGYFLHHPDTAENINPIPPEGGRVIIRPEMTAEQILESIRQLPDLRNPDRVRLSADLLANLIQTLNRQLAGIQIETLLVHPHMQIRATYDMLAMPAPHVHGENCSLCLSGADEEDDPLDVAHCVDHVFHSTCIEDSISALNSSLSQRSKYLPLENGEYRLVNPDFALLNCPNCRSHLPQNTYKITITDVHGDHDVPITRHFEQPYLITAIFNALYRSWNSEKFFGLYNVVQAGLAYLQKYPELAATLFKIQEKLLIPDFLESLLKMKSLYSKTKEAMEIDEDNELKFNIVAAITVVATAALSCLVVLRINAYLKPALVLKDLLTKLPHPPAKISDVSLDWDSPLSHQLMQCLYVNRIILNLALAFFSQDRQANLLSAVAQSFSLFKISQLRWIHLSETFSDSFTGRWGFPWQLKSRAHCFFMVDPACTKEASLLESTVRTIYESSVNLFNDSSKDNYWMIYSQFGQELNRVFHWVVNLPQAPVQPRGFSLIPTLTNLWVKANAVVHIKWAA